MQNQCILFTIIVVYMFALTFDHLQCMSIWLLVDTLQTVHYFVFLVLGIESELS